MKKTVFFGLLLLLNACKDNPPKQRFLPDSNGNINDLTVVMPEKSWKGYLGYITQDLLGTPYEGLPFDEPQFSLKFIPEEVFSGFARNSRNILWFVKDSIPGFQLSENMMAKPQLVAKVSGEDEDVQAYFLEENIKLYRATLNEMEQSEKLRRIMKSTSKVKDLKKRFNITLTYPTAYETFKDTVNFTWIQKPIRKGHMNLIAYSLPLNTLSGNVKKRVLAIRDSIGKTHIPGRLKGSYMITERAYRPYFYKTKLNGKLAYITKGTWEVANDFMAGPFVNYMIKDTLNKRWMVVEGFTFAPSASKRDYMFELNTILSSIKFQ